MRTCSILSLLLGINGFLIAQTAGTPDTTFGDAGSVRINLDEDELCHRLLTDADGNLYLVGNTAHHATSTDLDYFIAKLDPNGNPVADFGHNGHLTGDFGRFRNSRIVDADLRGEALYVIGEGNNAGQQDTQQVFIGKLHLDGNWDPHFGDGGLFTRAFVSEYAVAGSVRALEDGGLVFCGMTADTNLWRIEMPLVGRLRANGTPDSSFGGTGIITWSLANGLAAAKAAHVDGGQLDMVVPMEDGFLLGGFFFTSAASKAMLLRLDHAGRLVGSFGQDGMLFPELNPGLNCRIFAGVRRGQETFLAAKVEVYAQGEDMAFLRLDSSGKNLQYETVDFYQQEDQAQDILIDHHGHVLLAGYSRLSSNHAPGFDSNGFAVASLMDPSHLDDGFADNGRWYWEADAGKESGATAMCETPDGKLLVAGYVAADGDHNYSDMVIVRLMLDTVASPPLITHTHFSLHPNPAQSTLFIENAPAATADIWDTKGRCLIADADAHARIEIAHLQSGIYVVEIAGKRKKFIKL